MTLRPLSFAILALACLVALPALAQTAPASSGEPWWIGLVVALFAAGLGVMREMAPKTPNETDDLIVGMLSKLEPGQVRHLLRMLDPNDETTEAPSPNRPS